LQGDWPDEPEAAEMDPNEMSEDEKQSAHFLSLLLSLNQSALVALGKMKNPLTGQMSVDLGEAQDTIDLLASLKAKTAGNLDEKETKLLEAILADLRMHYVLAARAPQGPQPQ
jgi:uncharacterized protein DUF1844